MKIELKHIVGYLPYGLRVINKLTKTIYEVYGFDPKIFYVKDDIGIYQNEVRLALHPMSYLSDYHIAVLRHIRFPNSEQWTKQHWNYIKEVKSFPNLQILPIVEKLYEWHFDVHGLIENNLAIDINTL